MFTHLVDGSRNVLLTIVTEGRVNFWLSANGLFLYSMLICVQLLAVSDLFTERNQFEMMYTTLTELRKVHPSEDEILIQYLIPATCKAAAVLGMVRNSHGSLLEIDESLVNSSLASAAKSDVLGKSGLSLRKSLS